MTETKRYLSGIQPSGELHLGNYFGAIKQHVALQGAGNCFFFIANYHALTTISNAEYLRNATFDVAATYLALGLDPEKSVLFRQSDVPEVTELTWLLLTVTGMGLLERAVSYKDKVERGLEANAALFTYPVLMAADILAYDSNIVPVGQDQVQHVEMTRDMAGSFNHRYGIGTFVIPEYQLGEAPYVPGMDGRKMSKSYDNTIPIFDTGEKLRSRVMKIKTDGAPLEAKKDPETCMVYKLYSFLATEGERAEMADRYRSGGYGYGHAKEALIEKIEEEFAEARGRRKEYDQHPDKVHEVLREGGERARKLARGTVERARAACGVA